MKTSNLEANKEIVRRIIDGFNRNDFSEWDSLISPDCVLKSAPPGADATREGWKANAVMLHSVFPDIYAKIEMMVAEGEFVSVLETTDGTQTGDLMGFPANGNHASIQTLLMFQIKNGQIVAQWNVADMFGLMMQLGHIGLPTAEA